VRVRRFLLLALTLLAACSGDDGGTASPSTTTSTTEPPPAPVVDVQDRLEHRFDILGGPGWLAAGAGSVWVKTDHGLVDRIDPETNELVAEIEVYRLGLCQGLGADDEAVWTCLDRDLVRIDPATNEVAATILVDKIAEQGHLPVVDGTVWVLTGDGSTLVGVADDEVQTEIDLGEAHCQDLAAVDDVLFASCLSERLVLRIDLASGEVTDRVEVPEPRTIAAAPGRVWVGGPDGVTAIDPDTAEVLGTAAAEPGTNHSMGADEDGVWVRGGPFLQHVDAETIQVDEEIAAPETAGGEAIIAFGSIWADAYDEAVLYRLAPG
jgi:DNA-binding beta-propeller fold protein YncE